MITVMEPCSHADISITAHVYTADISITARVHCTVEARGSVLHVCTAVTDSMTGSSMAVRLHHEMYMLLHARMVLIALGNIRCYVKRTAMTGSAMPATANKENITIQNDNTLCQAKI